MGDVVGKAVGLEVVGLRVEGAEVGCPLPTVGLSVVGTAVGELVGEEVGEFVGRSVGSEVG